MRGQSTAPTVSTPSTSSPTQAPTESMMQDDSMMKKDGEAMMKKGEGMMAGKEAVVIENFAYGPKTLTVKAGTAITFTNKDAVGHTATADGGSFDTGLLAKGQSKTITFNKKGTYVYHCTPHPNMKATIVVE